MTSMRNTILAAAAAFALTGMAEAADFSGTWVRASAPVAASGYPTYWLVRSEPIIGGGGQNYVMEVKQQGNALQVEDFAIQAGLVGRGVAGTGCEQGCATQHKELFHGISEVLGVGLWPTPGTLADFP